ncbi:MAG: hypothetical protein WCE52_16975 [Candidatus Acidiferrum sp.]
MDDALRTGFILLLCYGSGKHEQTNEDQQSLHDDEMLSPLWW